MAGLSSKVSDRREAPRKRELTWTATREGALVLSCTADNLALEPAEATDSSVVGDVLPEALARLDAAGSEGFTWSPALPALTDGVYP